MSEPQVTKSHSAFAMECGVVVNIHASPHAVWRLLTDAEGFPRWNPTVTKIDGQILEGEKIRIHAPGTAMTFTPRISSVVPDERMTWIGGVPLVFRGVRTFELRACDDGSTDFEMRERFSGLMLPLAGRSMPDFGPVFRDYAAGLRDEAERTSA